jgi:hypothetical protein
MRSLLKPRWIFIISTLPIFILLFICFGEYQVIKTLLNPITSILWLKFGLALLILAVLNFGYAMYLEIKKQELSVWYGFASLFIHIAFLYVYGMYADDILPFSIPRWMVSENIMIYVGTFLMPTLAYALLIVIVKLTPENKNHAAWKSFLVAVLVPILWYIFSQVVTPFWRIVDTKFGMHVIIIFFIAGTLLFLFFLVRSVYILCIKKGKNGANIN